MHRDRPLPPCARSLQLLRRGDAWAKIIEKHVTLDKRQPGPDQSFSIDLRDLALGGRDPLDRSAQGDRKVIHARERQIRTWRSAALSAAARSGKGEVVTQDMIRSKRPGARRRLFQVDSEGALKSLILRMILKSSAFRECR